jgi:hypothetical protein
MIRDASSPSVSIASRESLETKEATMTEQPGQPPYDGEDQEHECACGCGHGQHMRGHCECCGRHHCPHGHPCGCSCHGEVKVRVTVRCECGKPGKVPRPCCPPPEAYPQPGTADVPQPPPYHPGIADLPPWGQGKPPPGSPTEVPWFRGQIGNTRRNGPTFGPRKDEFLPYLLVRANSADRGARPLTGVFWESPDIYVVPHQPADSAPLRPATQGGVAAASAPNTLYAHVWNLGKAPAFRVRVEWWWFDPSLGLSRSAGHLIGASYVDLEDRFTLYPQWREVTAGYGSWLSRGSHAVVKCAQTWAPVFVNGGHECLVARAGDAMMDPVGVNQFSPATDRHVGQRNIAVVQAASPAKIALDLQLGWYERPGEAQLDVVADPPTAMEWLQLYTGSRNLGLRPPANAVTAGLLAPAPAGVTPPDLGQVPPESRSRLLQQQARFLRGCDPLHAPFYAAITDIQRDEAQVLRVRQRIDGVLVGGYTVVLTGRP